MQRVTIGSILGGLTASQYFSNPSQYLAAVGIDPDLAINDAVGDRLTSGVLRPSAYAKFSGSAVDANPYFHLVSVKDTLNYFYLNNGDLISYTAAFGSETLVGTAGSSSGNGAAYYNNYLYLATNTNISRYGPLSSSPSLTDSVWTGATLGSQTTLRNTTYPSIRGSGTLPNHPMHEHVDGSLYVGDFDSGSSSGSTRGKGLIHKIRTKYGSAEGDTNDGSAYNVLDLPLGYMPTCIASWGQDLVIGAIQTTNTSLVQGKAALFFWDTLSDSFYLTVPLPDPIITALHNANGNLFIFSGNTSNGTDVSNGYRISQYAGGRSVRQIYFSNIGHPPLCGGVDSFCDRLVWGGFTTVQTTNSAAPNYYPAVFALGSKDNTLPLGVHVIAKASGSASSSDGIVTCVKKVEQESFSNPKYVFGWRNASTFGIDKVTTTYGTSVWQSRMINVGQKFAIKRIRFNFPRLITTNHTLTVAFMVDDFAREDSTGLATINSTNYNNKRYVEFTSLKITGTHNFCLQLTWSGTLLLPVLLPIIIDYELIDG